MIDPTEFFKDYEPGQATGELPEVPELTDIKRELEQCKLDRDRFQEQARALAEEVERLESGGADYYAISNDDQNLSYDVRTGQLEVFEDMESAELRLKSLKSYKLLRVRVFARKDQTTEDQPQ